MKAMVTFEGHEEGAFFLMDVIAHEGRLWLVPAWLQPNSGGAAVPERIVLLSQFRHQKVDGENRFQFVLNNAVPHKAFVCPDPASEFPELEIVLFPSGDTQGRA